MKHVVKYLFLFVLFLPNVVFAQSIQTTAKQAIVVDYETGTVLLAKNPDEKMPTSSMSKVMTTYVVFDALKRGDLALDDTFTVSERAWRKQGSKMFVELGKEISVEDLLRGVIVQSGNDATIVLAEGLAGTEEAFADIMNAKAADLGMKNTHFMNASGWPDPNHYSSARDLAILTVAMIKNFPELYKMYAEHDFTYHNIKQGNRNPLLYRNVGADGVKTGHTESGGYGLIGSGALNGRRVVFVLNGMADEKERAQESAKIYDWALRHFENRTVIPGQTSVADIPVAGGKADLVPAMTGEAVKATMPRGAHNIKMTAVVQAPLVAPIKKGQEVGHLRIAPPNMPPLQAPLYAAQDVAKSGFFKRGFTNARIFLWPPESDKRIQ